MPTPNGAAVLGQINDNTLPDLCTVEQAARTTTATGGAVEAWAAVSPAHVDLPCRLSQRNPSGRPRTGGPSERADAEYTVALPSTNPLSHAIQTRYRLQVRSGPSALVAYALTLYVLGVDGPQSLNPFPMVWCTTTPQPGQ